jgi:hypothetical protein
MFKEGRKKREIEKKSEKGGVELEEKKDKKGRNKKGNEGRNGKMNGRKEKAKRDGHWGVVQGMGSPKQQETVYSVREICAYRWII